LKNAVSTWIASGSPVGKSPRIQVLSAGGSPVNPAVGVVFWADAGGQTTLTLDTLPVGWTAPSAGDQVYAYGPVVAPIAEGILALCDALGPSRASGYADTINTWNATLY